MSAPRAVGGVGLALALGIGTAFLSRAQLRIGEPDIASLRLSWRVDALPVERCRPRTPEELAALPVHMRTPEVCTGGNAAYVLTVAVDGAPVVADTIHGSGARADRPIYVFRDLELPAGTHEADVRFRPFDPEGHELPDGAVALAWSGGLVVEGGEVALITLDPEGRALERR